MKHLTLNSGHQMPMLGIGTWNAPKDNVGNAIKHAVTEAGYRHIDCAYIYLNEPEIGEALNDLISSGAVAREELFITSKVWNSMHAREDVREACEKTLNDLQLDYLDLYLVHWGFATPKSMGDRPGQDGDKGIHLAPIPMRETWEAMEELLDAGLVKSIGVANFTAPMLWDLLTYANVTPAVNQIELHPYLPQPALVDYCKAHDIALTAYSPLGSPGFKNAPGVPRLLDDPHVAEIAATHGKSPAQILLRYAIERGTIAIPKSCTPAHIDANINIFDFELSTEEVQRLTEQTNQFRYVDPKSFWGLPYFN